VHWTEAIRQSPIRVARRVYVCRMPDGKKKLAMYRYCGGSDVVIDHIKGSAPVRVMDDCRMERYSDWQPDPGGK